MFKKLHTWYLSQAFNPKGLGIFVNPFYFIRKGLYQNFKQLAPELKGNILDVGCGAKPYKPMFTGAIRYVGLDIENPGHPHDSEDIDFYYDGTKFPFENDTWDHAFCSEVVEHAPDAQSLISEIARVTKKNGLLLLSVPFVWNEHELPYDFGRFTQYGIGRLIEKNGFELKKVQISGHFSVVIAQLWLEYLRSVFTSSNKYINLFVTLALLSPSTVFFYLICAILPKNKSLYFNTVVLAQKK